MALRSIVRNRVFRWTLRGFLIALIPFVALFVPPLYRDATRGNEVAKLVPIMGLRPGMTAADVGAGEGRMTIPLAKRLGPNSRVFATEIDASVLPQLRENIARAGIRNVTVLEGTPEQTNLPNNCCEAIIMADVYHHLTDPVPMDASLFRALRSGGRLAVIDFAPTPWLFWLQRPEGVPEDRGGHGVRAALVTKELGRAGFIIERIIEGWWPFVPRRYCLIARKPHA